MAGALVARLPSSRHADVVYEVRLEGGRYTCDCPGFCRWKHCRHVTALEGLRALPARGEPTRVAAPPADDFEL